MKTIEKAKGFLRLCNDARTPSRNYEKVTRLSKTFDMCTDCIECNTRETFMWLWPELEEYKEVATDEEWAKYVKEQDNEDD